MHGIDTVGLGAYAEYVCRPAEGGLALKAAEMTCREPSSTDANHWSSSPKLTGLSTKGIRKGSVVVIEGHEDRT